MFKIPRYNQFTCLALFMCEPYQLSHHIMGDYIITGAGRELMLHRVIFTGIGIFIFLQVKSDCPEITNRGKNRFAGIGLYRYSIQATSNAGIYIIAEAISQAGIRRSFADFSQAIREVLAKRINVVLRGCKWGRCIFFFPGKHYKEKYS